MIKKTLFAIAILAACSVSAQAAIRTIDIEYVGGTSSGWIVGELPSGGATIDDATGLGLDVYHQQNDVQMTGNSTTFSSTGLGATFNASIDFQNAQNEAIQLILPGTGTSLANVPDGLYTGTVINMFGGANTNDLSVRIGTAAIPEPSAFAFGGLALALTGLRRFGRNWFGKSAA